MNYSYCHKHKSDSDKALWPNQLVLYTARKQASLSFVYQININSNNYGQTEIRLCFKVSFKNSRNQGIELIVTGIQSKQLNHHTTSLIDSLNV